VFGLDALRALAVSCVVFAHSNVFIAPAHIAEGALRHALFIGSHVGVEIFFVLSGFLIGRIVLRAPPRDLTSVGRFWMRRWLRTLPPYLLVLLVLALLFEPGAQRVARYLLFLQCSTSMFIPPGFFPVSWSLAVEEWFYLGLPFVVLAVRANPVAIALLLLAATVLRWALLADASFVFAKYYTWLRFDALLWGVLGAALSLRMPATWQGVRHLAIVPMVVGVLAVVAICVWSAPTDFSMRGPLFTVTSFAFACALPYASQWHARPGVVAGATRWLAAISYPLYLVHLELLQAAARVLGGWGAMPGIGAALLLAWGMHRWLERPLLAWRDRRVRARDGLAG
jgi:peptidoglycan/LPS O-acetylase OafA/YrhL